MCPSAALISTVLQYADQVETLSARQTRLSLSAKSLQLAAVKAALGQELERASRVSVIWDTDEEQLVRVLETPKPRNQTVLPPVGKARPSRKNSFGTPRPRLG